MGKRVLPEDLRAAIALVASIYYEGKYYIDEPCAERRISVFEEARRRSGINTATIRRHYDLARGRLNLSVEDFAPQSPPTDTEDIPDGLDVLRAHADRNAQYIAHSQQRWQRIIPVPAEPFGIAFVGDPHAENKGANLHALRQDLELIAASRMKAIMMGDLLDNFHHFGPRLAPKQASNRMSASEALGVCRWIVRDSGVDWSALILGNHDHKQEALTHLLEEWARQNQSRFYDWLVRVTYQWDGGQYSVLAAHDFKGHSIHNPLHGLMRRAQEDGTDDLYVAAHRHTSAKAGNENGFRNRRYNFMRVRGYKDWDDYAHTRGFPQQDEGRTGVAIINPQSPTNDSRSRLFFDVAEAVEYLEMLRNR